MPPWITATFDFLAVASFIPTVPAYPRMSARSRSITFGVILTALISVGAWLELRVHRGSPAIDADFAGGAGSLVVLDPGEWIGHRLTLARHVDIGSGLMTGRWVVLLVHHDCDICMARMQRFSAEANSGGSNTKLAVVQLPPYGPLPLLGPATVLGKVDEARDWFAGTPVSFLLTDGVVSEVHAQDDDRDWPALALDGG